MNGLRSLGERLLVHGVSHPGLSRAMARLSDLRLPRPLLRALIRAYLRAYRVDMSEAAQPVEAYATFNAFFTRRLREGARPVAAAPGLVVSPADSRVRSIGALPPDARLEQIKGRTYALEALLGSAGDARLFAAGVYATLYLSPSMYHRVHCPVDGRVRGWRYIQGRRFPVNAMAVRNVEGLFTVNERVSVLLDGDDLGPLALVMVGATSVGRITLSFDGLATHARGPVLSDQPAQPIPIRRGDELGVFNLGSTVVLLAADPRLRPAEVAAGDLVRMGQPLWKRG